jgi:segregation and condensation protein A
MSLNFKVEKFEGPLDLLLQLIEKEELSISEISLSKIADQYLESLREVAERDPDELADFLVVAAKLLLIKSRELLPTAAPIEEDGPSLETQLKMYKIFYEAAKKLEARLKKKLRLFFRDKLPASIAPRFAPPPSLTAEKLHDVFLDVLTKITPVIKYPEERMRKVVSIQHKIDHIRSLMDKASTMRFHEILNGSTDKTEVVVNFLALLELVRSRVVSAEQNEEFGEIVISKIAEEDVPVIGTEEGLVPIETKDPTSNTNT